MKPEMLRVAACRDLPGEWWYPTREPGSSNHTTEAMQTCSGCPVRAVCLVDALRNREQHGIWGGAGEKRRRRLRRAMREDRLDEVVAAHWRQLDGVALDGDRALLTMPGKGATHGNPSTQADGCDHGFHGSTCDPCRLSASYRGVAYRSKTRGRSSGQVAA